MILSALLSLHSTAQRPFFLLDTEVSLQGHAEAFKCLQAEDVFEFKALFAVFRFTQGTDEGKRNEGKNGS